jgi:hypothetical protein
MLVSFFIFILPIIHVKGYFTIVGSRTFVFGSDYEIFVTSDKSHDILELELKGEKFGEIIEKPIKLNFTEDIVKFDVSL